MLFWGCPLYSCRHYRRVEHEDEAAILILFSSTVKKLSGLPFCHVPSTIVRRDMGKPGDPDGSAWPSWPQRATSRDTRLARTYVWPDYEKAKQRNQTNSYESLE